MLCAVPIVIWWVCLTLVGARPYSKNDIVENEQTPHSEVHNEWFARLTAHKNPVYRCPTYAHGIPYAIPNKPDCEPPDVEKLPTQNITLTTYWVDFKIHPIDAVECYVEQEDRHVHKSFWGNVRRSKGDKYYQRPFLLSECQNLQQNQRTKEMQELEFITSGFYGTRNNDEPDALYWSDNSLTNKNTYLYHVDITINVHDNTITTVGPVLTESCKIDKGFCPTTRGILIWDKSQHRTCRLQIGRRSSCIKTGATLTCPELSITINDIHLSRVCGITLGSTGTGGYFSSQIDGEIFAELDGTEKVTRYLETVIPKPKPNRQKRATDDKLLHDPGVVTYVDYKLQQQYIIQAILSGDKAELWNAHQTICRNNAMMIDHVHHQAATGDATGMVQTLTGDKSLRATMHGDIANVWACEEIFEFQFLVRDPQNCTEDWPIRVLGEDKVAKVLWLHPIDHTVLETPTYTDCPPPPFYYNTGSQFILLDEKRYAQDLDILPNPGKSLPPKQSIKIAFNPSPLYTWDDLSGKSFYEKQLQKMNVAAQIGSGTMAVMKGNRPTSTEAKYMSALGGFWGEGFMTMFYVVFGLLILISCLLLLIYCSYYQKGIQDVLGGFWRIVGGIGACFAKCCGCKKGDKNVPNIQPQPAINVIVNGVIPPSTSNNLAQIDNGFAKELNLNNACDKYAHLPDDVRRSRIYPAIDGDLAAN